MKIEKAYEAYRLPVKSTEEDLGCHWSTVISYGEYVIVAGHYFPGFFGAVYEHVDDDLSCEGELGLWAVSDRPDFKDAGHAVEWALSQLR